MSDSPHHPKMGEQNPNQNSFISPQPTPPPPLEPPETLLPSPKKVKKISTATSPSSSTSGKHPIYRGIRSRNGKWVSEIREPKKTTRIWLGTYPSPEMAASAYDVAALALKGADALLNFPDHVTTYSVPASSSPQDIRRAAATAAALMKPESSGGEEEGVVGEQGRDEPAASNAETSLSGGGVGHEFIDEEALFHMPNLLMNMAEGMLVSPPRMGSQPSDDSPENSDADSLWSYI